MTSSDPTPTSGVRSRHPIAQIPVTIRSQAMQDMLNEALRISRRDRSCYFIAPPNSRYELVDATRMIAERRGTDQHLLVVDSQTNDIFAGANGTMMLYSDLTVLLLDPHEVHSNVVQQIAQLHKEHDSKILITVFSTHDERWEVDWSRELKNLFGKESAVPWPLLKRRVQDISSVVRHICMRLEMYGSRAPGEPRHRQPKQVSPEGMKMLDEAPDIGTIYETLERAYPLAQNIIEKFHLEEPPPSDLVHTA